jgi:hypothetical protein
MMIGTLPMYISHIRTLISLPFRYKQLFEMLDLKSKVIHERNRGADEIDLDVDDLLTTVAAIANMGNIEFKEVGRTVYICLNNCIIHNLSRLWLMIKKTGQIVVLNCYK